MSLIVNSTIDKDFIKYKGKLYKKTSNTVFLEPSPTLTPDSAYDSLEEGVFESQLVQDTRTNLRPVYIGINQVTPTTTNFNTKDNTYNVAIIIKNGINPFFGQGSSTCVSISGYQQLELNLLKGKSYYFNQTHISNTNNKLKVTLDGAGLQEAVLPGTTYTGTPGVNGQLLFIIPFNAPQTYYLSSEGGQFMGIKINVDRFYESLPSLVANFNLLSGTNYYTNLI